MLSHPLFTSLSLSLHQYMVNCNSIGQMPDVIFHIHGEEFTIPASAYVRQVSVCFPDRFIFNFFILLYFVLPSHSLGTMAAVVALAMEETACGSWVTSSSDSTTPSSTEPRTWWVWPRLDKSEVTQLLIL